MSFNQCKKALQKIKLRRKELLLLLSESWKSDNNMKQEKKKIYRTNGTLIPTKLFHIFIGVPILLTISDYHVFNYV